jgi:hypothetical protein
MYIPVIPLMMYYFIKVRSLNWFSYINPNIYQSGLFGHSKFEVLQYIPKKVLPKTIYSEKNTPIKDIKFLLRENNMKLPLVVKPDTLYRGIGVQKILSYDDLENISIDDALVFQELSIKKKEFGVFYIRYPNQPSGKVVSLIEKEFMYFIGDGFSTLDELINNHPRAWLYQKTLQEYFSKKEYSSVPIKKSIISANFVGSHNKGTIFLNKNKNITPRLSKVFDVVTKNVPEFYYGRYDVKADSIEHLENGDFEILELNGALAEPVHIYDPSTTIIMGYKTLFKFWKIIGTIANQNKQRKIKIAKKTS